MSDWSSVSTAVQEAYSDAETLSYKGQNTAQVTLRCPWASRYAVAVDVINRLWPGGAGQLVSTIDIKPAMGHYTVDAGGKLVYEEALITLHYDVAELGSLEDAIDPVSGDDVKCRERIEPSVEMIKVDNSTLVWGTSGLDRALTPEEIVYRQYRGYAISRTIYNLPQLDPTILDLTGKCNQASYTSPSLGLTFPAETLAFGGMTHDRTVNFSGAKRWTVNIKFPYRKDGWNKHWRKDKSGGAGYDAIYDTVNAAPYKNFPTADFSKWLF